MSDPNDSFDPCTLPDDIFADVEDNEDLYPEDDLLSEDTDWSACTGIPVAGEI